jgi:hypothetical protein
MRPASALQADLILDRLGRGGLRGMRLSHFAQLFVQGLCCQDCAGETAMPCRDVDADCVDGHCVCNAVDVGVG